MIKEFRYKLETGSRKHLCPNCSKKTFVRYYDTETNDLIPNQYGRCDRENKCKYHLNPYADDYHKTQKATKPNFKPPVPIISEPVFFDFDTFKRTLSNYDKNVFIQNLLSNVPFPFDASQITDVIETYRLGTVSIGYRAGAVTFPFIDVSGNVRAVQVKQFDKDNHTTGTDFLHSMIEKHHKRKNEPLPEWLNRYLEQDRRVSCLFGEHLIPKHPRKIIALAEAPKTAIYGSLYFPDLLWMAVYNKSSFSINRIKVLQGKTVLVFPDLSKGGETFNEWKTKAEIFEKQLPNTKFIFSDLLERLAPEADRNNGNDLADFLIKLDWKQFKPIDKPEPLKPEPNEQRADDLRKRIEANRNEIARIEKRIKRSKQRFKDGRKNTDAFIAQSAVKLEWYVNQSFTYRPIGINDKIKEIRYWCS